MYTKKNYIVTWGNSKSWKHKFMIIVVEHNVFYQFDYYTERFQIVSQSVQVIHVVTGYFYCYRWDNWHSPDYSTTTWLDNSRDKSTSRIDSLPI